MTPDTRAQVASLLLQIQDLTGAIAVILANDPTEQLEPPRADDDPTLCDHPEQYQQTFPTNPPQTMCMSCTASTYDGGQTWR